MHLAAAAVTSLSIMVSPTGTAPWHHSTLTCGPAGGTLPHPPAAGTRLRRRARAGAPGRGGTAGGPLAHAAAACTRLAQLRRPFAPVPRNAVCSQIYGGPDVARVSGVFRGHPVWAVFRRRNGCETARWNALTFLLGRVSAAP